MAENNNPVSEPLQKTGQAASAAVNTARTTAKFAKSAAKLGKSIAAAAKGASAGGIWGAIAAFAWENRRLIFKITIAASAILLIPILIICMLPSVIFDGLEQPYSVDNKEALILNDSTVISSNIDKIYTSLGSIMSEAKEDILSEIEDDFEDSEATQKEIIDSHPRLTDQNVMSFVSQYSASKSQDWRGVSITDMDYILSNNKGKLYSYTTSYEDRTKTVYNESVNEETGEKTITETEVTETWAIYTIVYNGAEYFADNIFHLSDEQKQLAKDYEANLILFLNDETFN